MTNLEFDDFNRIKHNNIVSIKIELKKREILIKIYCFFFLIINLSCNKIHKKRFIDYLLYRH